MNVLVYEVIYRIVRIFNVPISRVFGSHEELQEIILSVAGPPGTALDLGCGDGRDAIFLAKNGFDVTAVDFSRTAIKMARINGEDARVVVNFIQDDLTKPQHLTGTFDLVIDIGAFNDSSQADRDLYMNNVLPLTHLGSRYFLMCFTKKLLPEEIERRFGDDFTVELLGGDGDSPLFPGVSLFLMTNV